MKRLGVLLLLTSLPAAAQEQLFVQASRINLRAEASSSAAVVSQFTCGASCEVLAKNADGWVQCRIGVATGWTKADLLGPSAPTYEDAIAKAKDAKLPAADRLNFGLRAIALRRQDAEAQNAVRAAYAEAELAAFAAQKPSKKTPPTLSLTCNADDFASCISIALGADTMEPYVLSKSAPFVVLLANRKCSALTSMVVSAPELRDGRDYTAKIVRQVELSMNPELYSGIFARFEPPQLPACDELKAREGAMRGLPRNWVMLTEKDGELMRTSQCNYEDKFVIVDSPKGYTLREEPIEGGNWYEATSVSRVDGGVQFETDRGTATLIWPARPDVAQFVCPKLGMSYFVTPANKVGKFKVHKYKCD